MKSTLALILPAMAVFSGTAMSATLFQVDFDNSVPAPPDNTQAGWEAFSETAEANNKTVSYSGYTGLSDGNISITTSGVQFTRNHTNGNAAAPDFFGTDLDRMYHDLILRNSTGNLDITVGGLTAGTYQIITHHLSQGAVNTTGSAFNLLVQDADSASFSQNVGTFNMGKSGDATTFAPTVAVFNVTSNGIDPVILRMNITETPGGGQGGWVGFNGMEIAIPEPSSLLLSGLGALALLRRRR